MERDKKAADLVLRESAEFAIDDLGSAVRASLENVPDRWAPVLAPITDLQEVRAALVEMVQAELASMSQRAARRAQDGIVVREQAHEAVKGQGIGYGVEAPPAGIALEHRLAADVLAAAQGLDQHLGQGRRILEAEIEALSGNRVHAVGGVAHHVDGVDHAVRHRRLAWKS
jgi:hypothetical protein